MGPWAEDPAGCAQILTPEAVGEHTGGVRGHLSYAASLILPRGVTRDTRAGSQAWRRWWAQPDVATRTSPHFILRCHANWAFFPDMNLTLKYSLQNTKIMQNNNKVSLLTPRSLTKIIGLRRNSCVSCFGEQAHGHTEPGGSPGVSEEEPSQ